MQTYKYDSEGNLIKTTETENEPESYDYDGADLTQYVSSGSGTFTYTYDDNHNLETATNDTVTMTLTNNAMGLATAAVLKDNTGTVTRSLQSGASYSGNGQYQSSFTDVNGNTTSFTASEIVLKN